MRTRVLKEVSPDFNRRKIAPIKVVDSRRRWQHAFELTRDGFTMLMRYVPGQEATQWFEKFIAAFNKMEAELLKSAGNLEWDRRREKGKKVYKTLMHVLTKDLCLKGHEIARVINAIYLGNFDMIASEMKLEARKKFNLTTKNISLLDWQSVQWLLRTEHAENLTCIRVIQQGCRRAATVEKIGYNSGADVKELHEKPDIFSRPLPRNKLMARRRNPRMSSSGK